MDCTQCTWLQTHQLWRIMWWINWSSHRRHRFAIRTHSVSDNAYWIWPLPIHSSLTSWVIIIIGVIVISRHRANRMNGVSVSELTLPCIGSVCSKQKWTSNNGRHKEAWSMQSNPGIEILSSNYDSHLFHNSEQSIINGAAIAELEVIASRR